MITSYAINYQNTGLDWLIIQDESGAYTEITQDVETVYSMTFSSYDEARYWIDEYFLAMSDR